jgi:hypothetical protein
MKLKAGLSKAEGVMINWFDGAIFVFNTMNTVFKQCAMSIPLRIHQHDISNTTTLDYG